MEQEEMQMKANCQRCYHTGVFIPQRGLASCNSARITEPTIIEFDGLINKERQYVKRNNWDDECACEHFIPYLSESREDFELEEVCTYETSFDCPFCGESIDVYDIGIDETKLIMCHNCEREIAVKGKEI